MVWRERGVGLFCYWLPAFKLLLLHGSSAAFLEQLRNVPLSSREHKPVSIRWHLFYLCAYKRQVRKISWFFFFFLSLNWIWTLCSALSPLLELHYASIFAWPKSVPLSTLLRCSSLTGTDSNLCFVHFTGGCYRVLRDAPWQELVSMGAEQGWSPGSSEQAALWHIRKEIVLEAANFHCLGLPSSLKVVLLIFSPGC